MKGNIIPAITALDENGKFDEKSQKNLIKHLAANDADAVFLLGLTGESRYLANETRLEIIDATADYVSQLKREGFDFQFLVGANASSITDTLHNIRAINRYDSIDGIVVQPSSIKRIDCETSEPFIIDINEISGLPIFLYSNSETAIDKNEILRFQDMRMFSKLHNIAGVKVSENYGILQSYLSQEYAEKFDVYIGNALDMFHAFRENFPTTPSGVITGPGNAFPKEWKAAWDLVSKGNFVEAEEYRKKFEEFRQTYSTQLSKKNTIGAIKGVLYAKGIISSPKCFEETGNLTQTDLELLKKYK